MTSDTMPANERGKGPRRGRFLLGWFVLGGVLGLVAALVVFLVPVPGPLLYVLCPVMMMVFDPDPSHAIGITILALGVNFMLYGAAGLLVGALWQAEMESQVREKR